MCMCCACSWHVVSVKKKEKKRYELQYATYLQRFSTYVTARGYMGNFLDVNIV